MTRYIDSIRKVIVYLQLFFIFLWTSLLTQTDGYASVYVLCCIAAAMAYYNNVSHGGWNAVLKSRKTLLAVLAVSFLFSVAVLLANYPIFIKIRNVEMIGYKRNLIINSLHLLCALLGGIFVAGNILICAIHHLPIKDVPSFGAGSSHKRIFLFSFLAFFVVYVGYLFFLEYPAHISKDSYLQICQAYNNEYILMHPFWHTMLIKMTMSIGYFLFSDINAAAACYSFVQILLMSGIFAYVVVTLYQGAFPSWCIIAAVVCYAISPYNIALSITMWKDVPFSLGIVLFVTALFRCLREIGESKIGNYVALAAGAAVACLMRTNGVVTFAITLLLMAPFLWKRHRKILLILLIVLLVCCFLTNVVPGLFSQKTLDYAFLEPLSVPVQQIARVITEGHSLTGEQIALINKVINIDDIPALYVENNIDALKVKIWENDLTYLKENKDQYFRLWVDLGLKYPWTYVEAWVEQTKGYWNGGYDYYQYAEMMYDNPLGLEKTYGHPLLVRLKYLYFGLVRFSVLFEPLNSIGLNVWIMGLCCFLNIIKRKKEFILCIPALIIILGLSLGAPVFSEFRYTYPVFLCIPLILPITMFCGCSVENQQS